MVAVVAAAILRRRDLVQVPCRCVWRRRRRRPHTLTRVERNCGYAVSQAYAGHAAPKSNQHGVTRVYAKAGIGEVATAVQALTRERHPLALAPSAVIAEDDPSPLSGLAG